MIVPMPTRPRDALRLMRSDDSAPNNGLRPDMKPQR